MLLAVILLKLLPAPLKKLAIARLPKLALPADIFPVAVNVLAEITFALVMLPPEPLPAIILPADKLPVTLAVPLIFAPVPVITTTLALPAALKFILPFTAGMFTLLVPLLIFEMPPLPD